MVKHLFWSLLFISCTTNTFTPRNLAQVDIDYITKDSLNIRAITIMDGNLAFAGADNLYGIYNTSTATLNQSRMAYDSLELEFRAVGHTRTDFFMLNVGNPALMFKTGDQGVMEVVYEESHEKVFYDAMAFWNDREGIAMGDPVGDCLSVIITRDGGNSWSKLDCSALPELIPGEAAFAASNTNIAVFEDHTWIATGGMSSRIYHSPDKGRSWEVFDTPVIQGEPTRGMYSIDFYDDQIGFAVGGDYTKPEENTANKALTLNGGRDWELTASGEVPGYMSCVQFVPGSEGKELVAVGFQGVYFSNDMGRNWKKLSDKGFYTLRFIDADHAFAAGKNSIARLTFSE